jgi:hypothetical protein
MPRRVMFLIKKLFDGSRASNIHFLLRNLPEYKGMNKLHVKIQTPSLGFQAASNDDLVIVSASSASASCISRILTTTDTSTPEAAGAAFSSFFSTSAMVKKK